VEKSCSGFVAAEGVPNMLVMIEDDGSWPIIYIEDKCNVGNGV
jgi:hypothetical protein